MSFHGAKMQDDLLHVKTLKSVSHVEAHNLRQTTIAPNVLKV